MVGLSNRSATGVRNTGVRPNFLFIGPDKAGSSWLYSMLSQHDDVFVAPAKDIYFFDRYYGRGMQWYESHFDGAVGESAVGEFSHDYLFSEEAAERIREDLPGVRLITLLRDPAERAFSEFLFLKRHALIGKRMSFREAVERDPGIIDRGMYGKHLFKYWKRFERDELFVGNFTDIIDRPLGLLTDVCAFLGVSPPEGVEGLEERVLRAGFPRIGFVAYIAKRIAMILRERGWSNVVGRLKGSPIIQKALYQEYQTSDRPILTAEDRAWLHEIFAPDMNILAQWLGENEGKRNWDACGKM